MIDQSQSQALKALEMVKALQMYLQKIGMYTGPIDGDPGPGTRSAVLKARDLAAQAKASAPRRILWYPEAERHPHVGSPAGTIPNGYPSGAVVHWTAGRPGLPGALAVSKSSGYSYFIIDRQGKVAQTMPLNEWDWHCGRATWKGQGAAWCNTNLVGIELIAAGLLRRVSYTHCRPWYNEEDYLAKMGREVDPEADIPVSETREIRFKDANCTAGIYHKYTDVQEIALMQLLQWLRDNDPRTFSFANVVGHDEISPGRKVDPGGALSMTMPKFRELLSKAYTSI